MEVIDSGMHIIPGDEDDRRHSLSADCPCRPLAVQNVPGFYHRTLAPA